MTNQVQNPDVTETQNATGKSPDTHMLTILVDLSHPIFQNGARQAKLTLIEILRGCAEGVVIGAEATVIGTKADCSDPVGVFLIARDEGGESKAALGRAISEVQKLQTRTEDYTTSNRRRRLE